MIFGVDIYTLLDNIVIFDALLVLVVGMVAASMYLFGAKFDVFWNRVVPAVATLVFTSLGAGAVAFLATKMFQ